MGLSRQGYAERPASCGRPRSARDTPDARLSGRESRSGERPGGSKWVKRREPRHSPARLSRAAGNRRGSRVLIFDKWVARPRSTGQAPGRTLREESRGPGDAPIGPHELSTELCGETGETARPAIHPKVSDRGSAAAAETRHGIDGRGASGIACPVSLTGSGTQRCPGLTGRGAPHGAPSPPRRQGAPWSGARGPTGSARDRWHGYWALSADGAEGPRARGAWTSRRALRGRAAPLRTPVEAGERQHRRHPFEAERARTLLVPSTEAPFVVNDAPISGSGSR